jgi:hypothetical protein
MKHLLLAVTLVLLAFPASTQGKTISEEAQQEIKQAKHESAVKEAKELLLKREELEAEIQKINERLKALDQGAPSKEFAKYGDVTWRRGKDGDVLWNATTTGTLAFTGQLEAPAIVIEGTQGGIVKSY